MLAFPLELKNADPCARIAHLDKTGYLIIYIYIYIYIYMYVCVCNNIETYVNLTNHRQFCT